MTLSPRLPSGLACDTAGSGPAGAELSRMTELSLSPGARSVAIGRGRSAAAAAAVTAFAPRGHGYVFTTRDRPVRSVRGWTAAPVRHGVSVIRSGQRYTLGLVFHDAA